MAEETLPPPPTEWPELDDPAFLETILDIIASEGAVDRDAVVPTATLETLGIASMDVMMILMGGEEKLDAYVPMDAEIAASRNLSEFIAAIDQAMKAANEPAAAVGE
jgi:acyl carrier protein